MIRVLERGLHVDALAIRRLEALLHPGAARDDVEAPFREVFDLVLGLADDDLDDGLVQPGGLGRKLPSLLRERFTDGLVSCRLNLCTLHFGRPADIRPAFAFQPLSIIWNMRAQVILSMQTSIDLPDCHRVAQCSTKSAAIFLSRSSAVTTS